MEDQTHFESPEAEIEYLERKIMEKRQELSERPPREVVRETIGEHIQKVAPLPEPQQTGGAASLPPDATNQVSILVQVALRDGIEKAVKRARETHNPYLIDAFHDALVDKFLDRLKSEGLLYGHG